MTANQVERIDEPDLAIFRKRPMRSVPVGRVGERTVAVDEHGADRGSSSANRCGAELPGLDFKALGQVTVERPAADGDNEIRCDRPRLSRDPSLGYGVVGIAWASVSITRTNPRSQVDQSPSE